MTNNIIIIPTYNERENIPIILERIFENVPDSHVLIVDDNSPDKTAEIVESLKSKYKNL
ncbi:glycosyltransferase, partial [Candidatus Woesearchaeota archaeon]|nr:glycosyltransferase [Candidatus Woesearchaeota archaeon]MBT7557574.1 glycosyltransferase [Candidatus Woesearchaeota archaeon]